MKVVSTEELINYKILPFNIYSEFGEKLFAAGEVLTPGKLLQLRHMNLLYRDEEVQSGGFAKAPSEEKPAAKPATATEKKIVVEKFDMKPAHISKDPLTVDDIDILSYKGPINKQAKIDPQTQIKIKAFYNKILEMMEEKRPVLMLGMFANVRDKIVQDIIFDSEALYCSQLKLLGEYNKCHALNVAILGGSLARKMELNETLINDIVLAGLLHDIGKTKISSDLYEKKNLTNQELKLLQSHTNIGYKIIKNEMELSENIAKVALDHHECTDASGYPSGKSGEALNVETKIINVCNYFDNITSNRTQYKVKNTKEALRVMLEIGTKHFDAATLYTFVHMFNYNDTVNFEEMVL